MTTINATSELQATLREHETEKADQEAARGYASTHLVRAIAQLRQLTVTSQR